MQRVVLCVAAFIAAVLAGVCIMEVYSMGALGESNESPSLSQIEAYSGMQIPPYAGGLRARLDQVMTKRLLFVRFTIDPKQLDDCLRESPFHEPLLASAVPDLLKQDTRPEWFTPERARRFLAGETARQAILVDTSEPSSWVVYVAARS
jgi:hypothetical protein